MHVLILLIIAIKSIFRYDFETLQLQSLFSFDQPLKKAPLFNVGRGTAATPFELIKYIFRPFGVVTRSAEGAFTSRARKLLEVQKDARDVSRVLLSTIDYFSIFRLSFTAFWRGNYLIISSILAADKFCLFDTDRISTARISV